MHIDVQSRGFSLTRALQQAVVSEAQQYCARCPKALAAVRVRLYDTNGPRGGIDKACLVQAHLSSGRESVVASHVDADLYRAIAAAFAKLERGTRSALQLRRAHRRRLPDSMPRADSAVEH
jgi:putative sigma-54 modulation protein